jgi:hypothetical protein
MRILLSLFVFSLLAGSAQAQLSATGVVTPVGPFSFCMQGETHALAGTGILMKAKPGSGVDLYAFEGQNLTVFGNDISVTCRVWEITAVQPPTITLTMVGVPAIGTSIDLIIDVDPAVAPLTYTVWASPDSIFHPIVNLGVRIVGINTFVVGSGTANPSDTISQAIPNNLALVGRTYYAQAANPSVNYGISNAVLIEIV